MSYFYLPKIFPQVKQHNIKFKFNTDISCIDTYIFYLQSLEKDINETYKNCKVIKKKLNPYSILPNIIINKYNQNELLFIELFNYLKYNEESKSSLKTFHFNTNQVDIISSIISIRNNSDDIHYAIYSDIWKDNHDFLNKHIKQIKFDNELTNSLNTEQSFKKLISCYKNYFDFITILDLDNPVFEYDMIIYVIITIFLLSNKGCLIFKIPNLLENKYIELLFFICNYFEKITIVKPNISNYFSNNKYVICKSLVNNVNKDFLEKLFKNLLNITKNRKKEDKLDSFLDLNIPTTFLSRIDECNSITGQNVLDNFCYLHNICKLCNSTDPTAAKSNKINEINEKNKQKCINWCLTNGIEYNQTTT